MQDDVLQDVHKQLGGELWNSCNTCGHPTDVSGDNSPSHIRGGVLAGIVIGVVVVASLLVTAALLLLRRHRRRQRGKSAIDTLATPAPHSKASTTSKGSCSLHGAAVAAMYSKRGSGKAPTSLELTSGAAPPSTTTSSGYTASSMRTGGTVHSVQGSLGSGSMRARVHSSNGEPSSLPLPLCASLVPQPPSPRSELQLLERRIAPVLSATACAHCHSTHKSPHFTVDAMPETAEKPGKHARIAAELNALAASNAPLFAGQWHLLREQRHGGQAVVQFARHVEGNPMQYAIKCVSAQTGVAVAVKKVALSCI